MRALDVAGEEAPPFAAITPPVRGSFQWVGTNALIFVPEGRLARATTYRVTVPAGTKALDGSALQAAYNLEFKTARPSVERVEPSGAPEALEPRATFTVHFNQPVADAEVARAVSITAAGKSALFDVRRPDPKDEARATLVPRAPLPLDSEIQISSAADLRGAEGPLPAGEPRTTTFRTYGPLKIKRASCAYNDEPCEPGDGSITLEFTSYVKASDAAAAVQIDPPTPFTADGYGEADGPSEVWLRLKLAPSTKFRVRVRSGVRDQYGQALASAFEKELTVGPRQPDARVSIEGSIFAPSAPAELPIASINLKKIDIAAAPLTEQGVLDLLAARDEDGDRWWGSPPLDAIAALPGASRSVLSPTAALNAPWSHALRTDALLAPKTHLGVFAAAVRYTPKPGAPSETRGAILQSTDLAISAKISRFGALVRVTRVSTAAPVPGASVAIRPVVEPASAAPPPPDVFQTDTDGFASIPVESLNKGSPFDEGAAVIFAKSGDEWTYRRVRDGVDVPGGWATLSEPSPLGLVFTDRPIYRPGDVVRVKGVFREEGPRGVGLKTPAGTEIQLTAGGPGGTIGTASKPLSAFGTIDAAMKIPDDAKLGYYRVEAREKGRDVIEHASFFVAEYRPNESRVTVKSDKPSYIRGEKARFAVRGEYLFGAPVSGGQTRVHVSRRPASFRPAGLDDALAVDDIAYSSDLGPSYRRASLVTSRGRLDARGDAEVIAPLDMPDQRRPESIQCDVEVEDASRQAVADQSDAIVHPAEVYIAMRPPADRLVRARAEIRPEILVVDPKGARKSDAAVRLDLIERTWKPKGGGGSWSDRGREPVDRVVAGCSVTSSQAPTSCPLTPPSAGYYIVRATALDRRGNTAATSSYIYAVGDGEPSWSSEPQRGVALDVVPDKPLYDVGQSARLLVKSPFSKASAIVTVERAGVISRRVVALAGKAPVIDVPITEEMWPNAFVSVALFRAAAGASPEKSASRGAPAGASVFRLGYAELALDPNRKKLNVTLRPSAVLARPGAPVDIDVEVRDRTGAPARAEVTLYAVDEGVLSLAAEKKPDPLGVFAQRRSLGVITLESREDLARVLDVQGALLSPPSVRMGATKVSREPRQDFRTVAYYNPSILTDSSGRARATFKLPDGLTSYKVTAVAVAQDDRAGVAEGSITASLPLMARPALPRFFRIGDSINAGVVVASKLPKKARVEVTAAAVGAAIVGESKRVIDIEPNASTEVRFVIEAKALGDAKLHFEAKSDLASDSVSVKRAVREPSAIEAVALYGEADPSSEERLGDLSSIRGDVGGLELRLSSSALVGLDAGVEQLLNYPYGCTEQLTSRLIPLLPLRELARTYSIPLPSNLDEVIASAIGKIAQNQHRSGGFGLWRGSPEATTFLTAYVVFGLNEAKRYGARVPAGVIERAITYLNDELDRGATEDEDRAALVFALDVLAGASAGVSSGAPSDAGRAAALRTRANAHFAERSKLPLFAKALLAHAMVLLGADNDRIESIKDELSGSLRLDGRAARAVVAPDARFAALLDSDTRTSALILRALLAARPSQASSAPQTSRASHASHSMARPLALGILEDRRDGAWRTTQEAAWALLALDQYRRIEERQEPDFLARVSLGGAAVLESPFRGRSLAEVKRTVPASALAGPAGSSLTFTKDGDGSLFYQARLRYAPRAPPRSPLDRGFFVKKSLRVVDPQTMADALVAPSEAGRITFHGGDIVLAEIVVVTPSPRQYVVIDDPLPGGLEPIDTGLASTSEHLRGSLRGSARQGGGAEAFSVAWAREELRDDRALFFIDRMPAGIYRYRYLARATTLGSFIVPPTRAEEMYTPEVFGRSGADLVSIAPR